MKHILICIVFQFSIFISYSSYAQVGIGTTNPDVSSVLDVSSNSKGLLIIRLSTLQKDII